MQKFISWVEVPSVDFDRAVTFYNSVFKLNLEKHDFGVEKMAFFPNNEGAISWAANFNPSKNGVLVSFFVADTIDETLQRVLENKVEIVQVKTKIEAEGRDYFAVFIDSEGNKVGIYGI